MVIDLGAAPHQRPPVISDSSWASSRRCARRSSSVGGGPLGQARRSAPPAARPAGRRPSGRPREHLLVGVSSCPGFQHLGVIHVLQGQRSISSSSSGPPRRCGAVRAEHVHRLVQQRTSDTSGIPTRGTAHPGRPPRARRRRSRGVRRAEQIGQQPLRGEHRHSWSSASAARHCRPARRARSRSGARRSSSSIGSPNWSITSSAIVSGCSGCSQPAPSGPPRGGEHLDDVVVEAAWPGCAPADWPGRVPGRAGHLRLQPDGHVVQRDSMGARAALAVQHAASSTATIASLPFTGRLRLSRSRAHPGSRSLVW